MFSCLFEVETYLQSSTKKTFIGVNNDSSISGLEGLLLQPPCESEMIGKNSWSRGRRLVLKAYDECGIYFPLLTAYQCCKRMYQVFPWPYHYPPLSCASRCLGSTLIQPQTCFQEVMLLMNACKDKEHEKKYSCIFGTNHRGNWKLDVWYPP